MRPLPKCDTPCTYPKCDSVQDTPFYEWLGRDPHEGFSFLWAKSLGKCPPIEYTLRTPNRILMYLHSVGFELKAAPAVPKDCYEFSWECSSLMENKVTVKVTIHDGTSEKTSECVLTRKFVRLCCV